MPTDAPLMLSVSGLRGIVGGSLTPEVAARFAGAFGGWLRERSGGAEAVRVVIGRDGRAGGHMVHAAAVAGLTGAGCDVIDLGVAMTPTVGVMVDERNADGGMVVTASHNPQEWNGLKCLVRDLSRGGAADASAPGVAFAGEIIERFRAGRPALVPWGRIGSLDTDPDGPGLHVEAVLSAIGEHLAPGGGGGQGTAHEIIERIGARAPRVALDSVNGAGARGGLALLEALGCAEILHLRRGEDDGELSGLFPHPPEPTRENLSLPGGLCDAVRESGSDVGFAQDPDADRLAVIDERGHYIGEEYTLALGALAVLSSMGPDGAARAVIASNLSTSRMIDDVAARFGATVVRTAVGEANVVEAMKRHGSVIGGEGNGGVIFAPVTYVRDSLSAMAMVLALLAKDEGRRPLSALVADLPVYAIEKRKVELPDRAAAGEAVEKIAAAYAGEHLDRQDGVRVDFAGRRAWLHVRASNTEPIMRLIAEAPTPAEAGAVLDAAARVIGGTST